MDGSPQVVRFDATTLWHLVFLWGGDRRGSTGGYDSWEGQVSAPGSTSRPARKTQAARGTRHDRQRGAARDQAGRSMQPGGAPPGTSCTGCSFQRSTILRRVACCLTHLL